MEMFVFICSEYDLWRQILRQETMAPNKLTNFNRKITIF